ncbi:MAG TPA: hypothetical protein VF326_09125 [Anaerolineaceae bacterium]
MQKRLIIILVIVGIVVITGVLLTTGIFIGRAMTGPGGFGFGMMNGTYAQNMMGGYNGGGMMNGGMMGNNFSNGSSSSKPLTLDQAKQAVDTYLKGLNNADLALREIMVFNNNAYARIVEKSTGVGAMELLVNPANLSVYPEYGPNMMWNLKYSPMYSSTGTTGMTLAPAPRAGVGGQSGGMMDGATRNNHANPPSVSASMPVTPIQAVAAAQQFIDKQFPGYKADTNPDAFYGYYTVDILNDGKPTGMLSVNGFNQQVFLHTWHGNFIETSEY